MDVVVDNNFILFVERNPSTNRVRKIFNICGMWIQINILVILLFLCFIYGVYITVNILNNNDIDYHNNDYYHYVEPVLCMVIPVFIMSFNAMCVFKNMIWNLSPVNSFYCYTKYKDYYNDEYAF